MAEVFYYNPEIIAYSGSPLPTHLIEARVRDEFAGFAKLIYRSSPFKHFYLDKLTVIPEHRNNGVGHQLVERAIGLIEEHRCAGLLRDLTIIKNPDSKFYSSKGWKHIEEYPGWYGYNMPATVDRTDLIKAFVKTRRWIKRTFDKDIPVV
jgi:GNAT superfamily N-acetyltransferase